MNGGVRFATTRMSPFVVLIALLTLGLGACGAAFLPVRPSEPLAAEARGVHVDVTRVWLSEEVQQRGLAEDIDLVVEVRVRNDGARERKISPGSFSCWMELDARRPGETRALLPGGGGEGAFPGAPPDEGSLLAGVTIPPGQSRDVWALFHGYRFDGSERPRKVTLRIPLDDGSIVLALADPAHGALRWEAPAVRSAISIGIKDITLLRGGLRASLPGTEIVFTARRGAVLWDVGLTSSVLVETQGPLVSSTSTFTGSGLTAHLTAPFASWGPPEDGHQLGVFAGGSASVLVETLTPAQATANMMKMLLPNVYGFLTAEGGLELDMGAVRFAASPFPLSPDRRPLPSWLVRLGYVQAWGDGVTAGGFMTSIRFSW